MAYGCKCKCELSLCAVYIRFVCTGNMLYILIIVAIQQRWLCIVYASDCMMRFLLLLLLLFWVFRFICFETILFSFLMSIISYFSGSPSLHVSFPFLFGISFLRDHFQYIWHIFIQLHFIFCENYYNGRVYDFHFNWAGPHLHIVKAMHVTNVPSSTKDTKSGYCQIALNRNGAINKVNCLMNKKTNEKTSTQNSNLLLK